MADINKTIKDLDEQIAWIQDNDFHKFPGWGHAVLAMKDALELLKDQQAMNVDSFVQWCIDNQIVGDATIRGIKYWVEKFKEGR